MKHHKTLLTSALVLALALSSFAIAERPPGMTSETMQQGPGPDDQGMHDDGSVVLEDGSVVLEDGSVVLPDGSVVLPNGVHDQGMTTGP